MTEIYARETIFLPKVDGLKYLTLDGITFQHAASNWVANMGFQKGAVNTRMGAAWIIQNCHVADCKTCGICSGVTAAHQENSLPADANQYGHHIFRNNLIERCGESGFSGNSGYLASLIEGNLIQDINTRRQFGGFESAGIKIHYAVDVIIKNNIIRRVFNDGPEFKQCYPGIWLDWAGQGTRITGNIISDIEDRAIYLEADHGPMLIDNNVIINNVINSDCERIVLAHNLLVTSGMTYQNFEDRRSQFFVPHTRTLAGSTTVKYTGDRYFNNIYVTKGAEQSTPKNPENPPDFKAGFNIFYLDAQPSQWEQNSQVEAAFDPKFSKTDLPNGVMISFTVDNTLLALKCPLITADFIGKYSQVNQSIENHDGTGIIIDKDLLGNTRDKTNPIGGPFEQLVPGKVNTFTLIAGPRGNK